MLIAQQLFVMKKIPVEEWERLPIEVYQKTLDEVKEYFEEFCSETESVTDKSLKIFWGLLTFTGAAAGVIASKKHVICIDVLLGILIVYLLISLYCIIKSRQTVYRGVHPLNHLTKDYDKPNFTKEDKERLIYVNLIEQYMAKIDLVEPLNDKRAKQYNKVCLLSIVFIIAISVYLGFIY